MKPFIYVVTVITIFTTSGFSQSPVTVYGELRSIMRRGDLSPKVSLDTMKLDSTTVGIGVVAGLKGEILIVEGIPYVSFVKDGKVVSVQENKVHAAMLATSHSRDSRDLLTIDFRSMADLEKLLEQYSKGKPFAFIIDSEEADVDYHVIDWHEGENHTFSNHKQFAIKGRLEKEPVIIVGFFSDKPGTLTPHTSKIHLHVYHPGNGLVAHVEEINLRKTVIQIH